MFKFANCCFEGIWPVRGVGFTGRTGRLSNGGICCAAPGPWGGGSLALLQSPRETDLLSLNVQVRQRENSVWKALASLGLQLVQLRTTQKMMPFSLWVAWLGEWSPSGTLTHPRPPSCAVPNLPNCTRRPCFSMVERTPEREKFVHFHFASPFQGLL